MNQTYEQEGADRLGSFAYVQRRSVVYHERGTLIVINVIAFVTIVILSTILVYVLNREQIYAVPDIYGVQPLELKWGPHDQTK